MKKQITKEALALKKLREIKGLSRKEAAILLGIGPKTIEKMENGRTTVTSQKIDDYLRGYGLSHQDFEHCISGQGHLVKKKYGPKKLKVIEHKSLRRMYKKIITKEVKVLICLRKLRGYSQYQASQICGYARCSIGQIENGRIEIPQKRIEHIVKSYGFVMQDFEAQIRADILLSELQDICVEKIKGLRQEALKTIYSLLTNI